MPARTACTWPTWIGTSSLPGWTGPTRRIRSGSPTRWTISRQPRAPDAVGHRLVHGAEVLVRAAIVNDELRRALEGAAELAPLHVPVLFGRVVQIACWYAAALTRPAPGRRQRSNRHEGRGQTHPPTQAMGTCHGYTHPPRPVCIAIYSVAVPRYRRSDSGQGSSPGRR